MPLRFSINLNEVYVYSDMFYMSLDLFISYIASYILSLCIELLFFYYAHIITAMIIAITKVAVTSPPKNKPPPSTIEREATF